MQTNVPGRVSNVDLPMTQALLPLFEAVMNSIDAINDCGDDLTTHRVDVNLLRALALFADAPADSQATPAISGFQIIDDGIGFTNENWEAFNTADTQRKAKRGGKGVGRFIWLKAFDRVLVDSVYQQDDQFRQRVFEFSSRTDGGIDSHSDDPIEPPDGKRRTTVTLQGFKEIYERNAPRTAEIIAQRTVEYCLKHFILGNMPSILLHDPLRNMHIELDRVYEELVADNSPESFEVNGVQFDLVHLLLHAHSGMKHYVSYCADGRVAKQEFIGSSIPNLPATVVGDTADDTLIYAGYVSSPYLDEHANQQRTDFGTISTEALPFSGELHWPAIRGKVFGLVERFLDPYTEEARIEKDRRIREYVMDKAPEYRTLLKHHSERLGRIPVGATERELDRHLHEIQRQAEVELRAEADELLEDALLDEGPDALQTHLNRLSKWWDEFNDAGKASLAKYIVQRRVVLALLDRAIKRRGVEGYASEKILHRLIFPLRKTSDDVTFEEHNLWIIDEGLAYHEYLASDMPLKSIPEMDVSSITRPDLLVFNRPIALAENGPPHSSGVVIIELKRPMRKDGDPIEQVLGYIEEIRQGKATTREGRPIKVHEATPFYCYIVADRTDGLERQAIRHTLTKTADGCGFIGYIPGLTAYLEIMDYDKLLNDASRRNRILFDKLRLPVVLDIPDPEQNVEDA